jgi:hypothetical protein
MLARQSGWSRLSRILRNGEFRKLFKTSVAQKNMVEAHLAEIDNAWLSYLPGMPGTGYQLEVAIPKDPQIRTKEAPQRPELKLDALVELLHSGRAPIAWPEQPVRPISGACMAVFANGRFLVTRKDTAAARDPLGLVIPSGFPDNRDEWRNPVRAAIREFWEEGLVHDVHGKKQFIVPSDPFGQAVALQTAKRLGLQQLPTEVVNVEYLTCFKGATLSPEVRLLSPYLDGFSSDTYLANIAGVPYLARGAITYGTKTGPNLVILAHFQGVELDDSITAFDGEVDGKDNLLHRMTFAFKPGQLKGKRHGDLVWRWENAWTTTNGQRVTADPEPFRLSTSTEFAAAGIALGELGYDLTQRELDILRGFGIPPELHQIDKYRGLFVREVLLGHNRIGAVMERVAGRKYATGTQPLEVIRQMKGLPRGELNLSDVNPADLDSYQPVIAAALEGKTIEQLLHRQFSDGQYTRAP